MTDRIDLDELAGTDEEEPETGNRGDWLWRGDEAGDEDVLPEFEDLLED